MVSHVLRALVVDDEPHLRMLTIRALHREGFTCDAAPTGLHAQELLRKDRYDVVITDLRMPQGNGHALATKLLESADRPVVVILTGVLEPALAKDLIARGADCVDFKPVDYNLFAAKVRALVGRGRSAESHDAQAGARPTEHSTAAGGDGAAAMADLERRLQNVSRILPISPTTFDVFNLAISPECETAVLAAAVARDPSLSIDVLRIANSASCNPTGQRTADLGEAVVRIGQRRVGELALATGAMAAMTPNALPWLDMDLAWRRSIAAGVAADFLMERDPLPSAQNGLFLSAVFHRLGRIVLGMLYPSKYPMMLDACKDRHETLLEQEKRHFPLNHGEVMHWVLNSREIPAEIHEPLRCLAEPYWSVAALPEPLRRKVEVVKLAVLMAQIAVGQWEPWDEIELPPAPLLRRFGIGSLAEVIANIKADAEAVVNFRSPLSLPRKPRDPPNERQSPPRSLVYCNLSPEPVDFLPHILSTMGIRLDTRAIEDLPIEQDILVNAIWTQPHLLEARLNAPARSGTIRIVTDANHLGPYQRVGEVLSLPASYGALRSFCHTASRSPGSAPARS